MWIQPFFSRTDTAEPPCERACAAALPQQPPIAGWILGLKKKTATAWPPTPPLPADWLGRVRSAVGARASPPQWCCPDPTAPLSPPSHPAHPAGEIPAGSRPSPRRRGARPCRPPPSWCWHVRPRRRLWRAWWACAYSRGCSAARPPRPPRLFLSPAAAASAPPPASPLAWRVWRVGRFLVACAASPLRRHCRCAEPPRARQPLRPPLPPLPLLPLPPRRRAIAP